jgi:hypothetical protein
MPAGQRAVELFPRPRPQPIERRGLDLDERARVRQGDHLHQAARRLAEGELLAQVDAGGLHQ